MNIGTPTGLCVIDDLLSNPFSRRSIEEKNNIIKTGKPCPELLNLKSKHKEKNKTYVRSFNTNHYEKIHWLTGCEKLNKLFCWPCLLFSSDQSVWSRIGFDNLNTLTLAIARHEKSANHIKCFLLLNAFGRTRINHQLDEQKRISDMLHNEKVKKNREVLERLIDAICFLSKQELALRGHDESLSSLNKGNYIELLHLMSIHDPILKAHLKESTIFKGTSSAIQNDLIAAISAVVIEKIKEDIKETNFVALILDETSDIINKSQLSTVLRFVDKNGEIQERFLGFTDVSEDRTALGLFNHAIKFLKEYNCENKLIAQTYDGAAVMAGEASGLNKRIQDVYPSATFIHCYSHQLNLTLQQSVANIKECRLFFQTLSGLANFFSKSTKRTYALKQFVEKKLPSVAPTRWNFSSRLVNTVNDYYSMLKAFFEDILDSTDEWDNDAILKAQGLLTFLEKFQTQFFLAIFAKIFSYSDVLFNTLQTKSLDINYCARKIEEFSENIQELRDEDIMLTLNSITAEGSVESRPTRSHTLSDESYTDFGKRLRNEIIDNIKAQINDRFKSIHNFQFFALLDCNEFKDHKKKFPDEKFKSLVQNYGAHFDLVRLKTELTVMYSSSEFEQKSITDMLHFMHTNMLYLGMPEVYKLILLVSTIPATTASAERSFSSLRRIQNYLRSTQGQERLSALALLSIEKAVLLDMKMKTSFYDLVIEKFVQKSRRMEFVFK